MKRQFTVQDRQCAAHHAADRRRPAPASCRGPGELGRPARTNERPKALPRHQVNGAIAVDGGLQLLHRLRQWPSGQGPATAPADQIQLWHGVKIQTTQSDLIRSFSTNHIRSHAGVLAATLILTCPGGRRRTEVFRADFHAALTVGCKKTGEFNTSARKPHTQISREITRRIGFAGLFFFYREALQGRVVELVQRGGLRAHPKRPAAAATVSRRLRGLCRHVPSTCGQREWWRGSSGRI